MQNNTHILRSQNLYIVAVMIREGDIISSLHLFPFYQISRYNSVKLCLIFEFLYNRRITNLLTFRVIDGRLRPAHCITGLHQ